MRNRSKTSEAINALGEAAKSLPDGYEIAVRFTRDECSLALYDPDGEELDVYADDSCQFEQAICDAVQDANKCESDGDGEPIDGDDDGEDE
jgi:hypothetical protein